MEIIPLLLTRVTWVGLERCMTWLRTTEPSLCTTPTPLTMQPSGDIPAWQMLVNHLQIASQLLQVKYLFYIFRIVFSKTILILMEWDVFFCTVSVSSLGIHIHNDKNFSNIRICNLSSTLKVINLPYKPKVVLTNLAYTFLGFGYVIFMLWCNI